jgi:hypothetical protein
MDSLLIKKNMIIDLIITYKEWYENRNMEY